MSSDNTLSSTCRPNEINDSIPKIFPNTEMWLGGYIHSKLECHTTVDKSHRQQLTQFDRLSNYCLFVVQWNCSTCIQLQPNILIGSLQCNKKFAATMLNGCSMWHQNLLWLREEHIMLGPCVHDSFKNLV